MKKTLKITRLLILLLVMFSLVNINTKASEDNNQTLTTQITGDLTKDGEVDTSDVIYLLMHTYFKDQYPVTQDCDYNKDGEVNTEDVIYLLMHTYFKEQYPLDTHTHNIQHVEYQEATCSEDGNKEYYYCSECEKYFLDSELTKETTYKEVIIKAGHNYVIKSKTPETCTEDGLVIYECNRDGCSETKQQVLISFGHIYKDGVCSICGEDEIIHEHSYTEKIVLETCTEYGYTLHTCTCGHTYKDNLVEPKGHIWNDGEVTKEATCTANGIKKYTCTQCDETYTSVIPASHNYIETVITEVTCTIDGEIVKECTECGQKITEIIKAHHEYEDVKVTKEATCTETGLKLIKCKNCNEEITEEISPLGHIYENGVCQRCGIKFIEDITEDDDHLEYGMYFKIDDIISKYGSDYINEYGVLLDYNEDATIYKVAVYLTQEGTMWRRCIAVVGHNIKYATYVPYLAYNNDIKYSGLNSCWINTFSLKENSNGIWCYSNFATIGANLEDREGNLLLNLYNIGKAGAKTKIFDDLEEMIEWLNKDDCNHLATDWIIDKEATCSEAGSKHKECEVCGKTIEIETIKTTKHNYVNGECTICHKKSSIGLKYKLNEDQTSYIVSGIGTCTDNDIVIPSTYNDLPVTSIGYRAFEGCTSLTSIEIPNSVTYIGDDAFSGCNSLTSIEIPNSVTYIGDDAFSGCNSLTNVYYEGTIEDWCNITFIYVDSNPMSYANHFYLKNSNNKYEEVTEIEIPNTITKIGNYQFWGFSNVTKIIIPSSVTSIGYGAFSSCTSLKSIEIPNSVTSIGWSAFSGCTSLTNIEIPNSVTSIGSNAFCYCTSLTSIEIPNTVTRIGDDAFYYCTSLENVYYNGTIEDWCKITIITEYVKPSQNSNPMSYANHFYIKNSNNRYEEITEIEIPNTITKIGDNKFCGFNNVTKITIPDSVTSIGLYAFSGCTSLENVYYEGTIEDWCNISFSNIDSNPMSYANHFYLKNSNNKYEEVTEIEIPNTITKIGNYQFWGFSNVTKIIIPSSVTCIDDRAFAGCINLENVYYEGTIEDWCNISFSDEDSNADYLNKSGRFDSNPMFYADHFYIKNTNNKYEELLEIVIPNIITKIDNQFYGFNNVTKITIPNSATSIGEGAFAYCSSITNIEIPNSVTNIGDSAFFYCTNLTSIEIPNSVTSIGDSTFANCINLKTIIFEENSKLTSIGSCTFGNCTNLTSIEVPSSVTSIGDSAFSECTSLEDVYYNGTQEEWNNITFSNEYSNPMYYAKNLYLKEHTCEDNNNDHICDICDKTTSVCAKDDENANWIEEIKATCTEEGIKGHYHCSVCNKDFDINKQELTDLTIEVLGHNYVNGECTECGDIYKAYTYDSDNTNIIYFGSYPQSEVTDSSLKTILSSLSGTLPTSSNNYNWISYGYYISGNISNYMWYIDINYNNAKYRGVYFTSYRPSYINNWSSTSNSNQDDNGYYTSTVYWFKYEPIKWQILTESNGKAFLLADIALDSQEYYASTSSRTINGTTIYANNYEYSTIRTWLNNTFYNTAFNELEKGIIQTTLVVNSVSSTGYSSNKYACNNTNDKVFLLSYQEATTTYLTTDTLRIRKSTDYAKSQGCYSSTSSSYLGNPDWWLRSPSYNDYKSARYISSGGGISNPSSSVNGTEYGVVPALWIELECNHDLGD